MATVGSSGGTSTAAPLPGASASAQSPSSTGPSESTDEAVEGRLLDGFLLLAAGGSLSPEDAITVNLSSLNLVDVAVEDLGFFTFLDRLDASDNQLSYEQILAQMGRLPRLSSLNLACNSINALQVPSGDLRTLQILDLSFNGLHGDVLIQLSHVPNLVTLNLTSNCISSVPPEEDLYGLQNLEELILDQNDLVQFVQWRALDALRGLRKLSLASNRVKRLRDDAPDRVAGSGPHAYFPMLEELNLSNNEIVSLEALPVVKLFRGLHTLNLGDNPCSRAIDKDRKGLRALEILSEETKPWYLNGNGCFQAKKSGRRGPELKLDRDRLRKVSSQPQVAKAVSAARRDDQRVGVLDEDANQLFVTLGGGHGGSTYMASRTHSAGTSGGEALAPVGETLAARQNATPAVAEDLLGDDITEEELRSIFRERRETIARRFESLADEPPSFMRQAPAAIRASVESKLSIQQQQAVAASEEADAAAAGRSQSNLAFLTTVEDSETGAALDRSGGPGAGARRRRLQSSKSDTTSLSGGIPNTGIGDQADGTTLDVSSTTILTPAAADGSPLVGPGGTPLSPSVILPPIQEGSRELSGLDSTVGIRLAAAATGDISDFNVSAPKGYGFASAKQRPVADVGVREAMRALRAAATFDKPSKSK